MKTMKTLCGVYVGDMKDPNPETRGKVALVDLPFPELKEKVQGILAEGCNTGDGWLIAAEVIQYVEKGCGSVLILHPFGCLVSHVCERGILQRLHARFPDVSIQTIEYDYDQSKTLRESRILLAIS